MGEQKKTVNMLAEAVVIFAAISVANIDCLLFECHDDVAYEIKDGPVEELMFTWLGTLQYIHIKNGLPNYFRVPRVVLITRQFALCTAMDASNVPDGFALGNVVFGDYERDEQECRMTTNDLANGATCSPAILLMPIADVLIHPEFKHFNVKNSVALLKLLIPLRSQYMLPGCLPYEDYVMDSHGKATKERLFLLDFTSDVPRDFYEEDREVKSISLLPRELCYLYNIPWKKVNLKPELKTREVCSTGCGFHSGAPVIVHEATGHWTVVGLAIGGSPCSDPLRDRRPPSPSSHILLYPYVNWITGAITGKLVVASEKNDPFGFGILRARNKSPNLRGRGWVGHWWMGGIRCYDRGEAARSLFRFYHEVFQISPSETTFLTYVLEIAAPQGTIIICAKVGMPYRLGQPKVKGLNTETIMINIPLMRLSTQYRIQVEAWGYNTSTIDEPRLLELADDSRSLE